MLHRYFADNTSPGSVASSLRSRRFRLFRDMVEGLPGPVRVLDIGGRPAYWDMMLPASHESLNIHVTLINPEKHSVHRKNFEAVVGDGTAMPQFADKQFDIVFSNSTIEHVGTFEDQRRMASEVRRIGRRYYVQTPNRYFPIEPHFMFPMFQFLPQAAQIWLVRHFKLGWFPRIPDYSMAQSEVAAIRLLTRAEMRKLFPEAVLHDEKWFGLTKSFVAITP
jgi:hypothetical protein